MADLLIALAEYCADGFAKLLYFGRDDGPEKRWTWREVSSALLVGALLVTAVISIVVF